VWGSKFFMRNFFSNFLGCFSKFRIRNFFRWNNWITYVFIVFDENLDLFLMKNFIFDENFIFWRKFSFLGKIFTFNQNYGFWRKILIFDENFDFWSKLWFLIKKNWFLKKMYIFDENYNFWRKFWLLAKIYIFNCDDNFYF